ncbi:MAG: hypothetical protein ABI671_08295 [Burkholderiales bacterium]
MMSLRTLSVAAAAATVGFAGCAQAPVDHAAHHPDTAASAAGGAMPMGGAGGSMARMDVHMEAMQAMHQKMMRATTPEAKAALMTEQMKLMQDGMAMMPGMGSGGMMSQGGMGGMGGMGGTGGTGGMGGMGAKEHQVGDIAMHQQMMEKRMEMMQSMMQMMMDRMPQPAAKP